MKTQWQIYKELELLPDFVSAPPAGRYRLVGQLNKVLQLLIDPLVNKLGHEQQVNHLEDCLALDYALCSATSLNATSLSIWQKYWNFLRQSWPTWNLIASSEPQIWQSSDRSGQMIWHIYDHRTGRQIDLESETEVCIWIEKSFYR